MTKKRAANADGLKKLGINISIATGFDESSTMDCLHGDVVDGEQGAACAYEYSREAPVLFEAARRGREIASESNLPVIKIIETVVEEIEQKFLCGRLILQSPWLEFILCSNFPQTPWNQLPAEDRDGILVCFPRARGLMLDVRRLDAMGVFDSLKQTAARARAESLKHLEADTTEQPKPRLCVLPMVKMGQLIHILLTLDPDGTEAQWVKGFRSLLRENRKRFGESRDTNAGRTGGAKDMLKALASWRLFEHCEGDWRKANAFANEHRKVFEKPDNIVIGTREKRKKIRFDKGDPKPFHDPRRGQGEQKINEASLYGEESGFLKAKGRALAYLRQRIPWEFFEEAEDAEITEMRVRWGATESIAKEDLQELLEEAKASLETLQVKLAGSRPTFYELAQMSEVQLDQLVAEQSRRLLGRQKSFPRQDE